MHALKDLVRRTRKQGTDVLLSDVHSQPLIALGRSGLLDEIGEENLFGDVDAALASARQRLQPAPA
jgi:SulP family sulfate permease